MGSLIVFFMYNYRCNKNLRQVFVNKNLPQVFPIRNTLSRNNQNDVIPEQPEPRHPGKLAGGKFIRDLNNNVAPKLNGVTNK